MFDIRFAVLCLACICHVCCQGNTDDEDATGWILGLVDTDKAQPNQTSQANQMAGATVTTQTKVNVPAMSKSQCSTDDGKEGFCVKKSQCNKMTKIDPTTLFTLRERSCHYLQECCPPDQLKTKVDKPTVTSEMMQCGISNPGALPFREHLDKEYSEFGDFPWMVAILKRTEEGAVWSSKDYIGGGSLIHPAVVMTAAHKVDEYESKEIKCRAGEYDTQTTNEIYPHQERNVKKVIIHNEYLRLHARNDIALLILTEPFTLSPHIGVACIGRSLPPPATKCLSMGWGADFNKKKKYAVILKKIQLPIVSKQQCENNLRNTKLGSTYTLHNTLTCAGGEENVDTCLGDGGSPLVCPIENKVGTNPRYAVYGMVAYGVECGVKDVPGVYVNVPQMYQWIGETMVTEGFPRTGYDY